MVAVAKVRADVRFLIRTEHDRGYGGSGGYRVIELLVAAMGDPGEGDAGKVINPGYSHGAYGEAINPLADLAIRALHCDDEGDSPARWYGWEVSFRQPFNVDAKRAGEMLAVLKRVARALDAAEKSSGRPESFPAYALRVARAVGATASNPFGIHDVERSWDGTGYRWQDADGLACYLADFSAGKTPATARR